ncbi:AraC-like ligand-binding domain-containing protein [Mesorhizobium sp. ORM6]
MHAAAHHVSVADGEAFLSTSRLLFGPITQRFSRGAVPSIPQLVSVNLGACRLSEIKANSHLVVNDRLFWRSFDPDAIKILMQLSGRSRFEQQQVAVDLGPQSAIIYDPVRSYSCRTSRTSTSSSCRCRARPSATTRLPASRPRCPCPAMATA